MNVKALTLFLLISFDLIIAFPQKTSSQTINIEEKTDTIHIQDKDIVDVFSRKKQTKLTDTVITKTKSKNYFLSIVPAVGYTLQTGFAGIISANIGYYTDKGPNAKISSISTSVTYSEYNQVILPVFANIWTTGERYNIISDNRYISYPSNIYGLGGQTDPNQGHTINFSQIKLHQSIVKRIANNLYAGIGYYYDYFWNIKIIDPQTRLINVFIQKEFGSTATASGPIVKLLYDSRTNQINPEKGLYFNIVLRQNLQELGSDNQWASLLIDARTYINFPKRSKNVLALWAYEWLTPAGNPNYLLLPSNGWDDQYNTGRGYIQSRFRGKQMSYFETEYRYRISRNGLIGGGVFFNVEYYAGNLKPYANFLPGYGAGLRIKLNKKSGANLCLDYGFGNDGSRGFYLNLGEVF